MKNRPILVLDFDGVCHSYTSGWQGADCIPDAPVEGLWEFVAEATLYCDLHIYSSRSHQEGGIEAMIAWFRRHAPWHGPVDATDWDIRWHPTGDFQGVRLCFPAHKPPAFLTIDDRAIHFGGTWPQPKELVDFKPWNKR